MTLDYTRLNDLRIWPNHSIIAYLLFPLLVFWVVDLYQCIWCGIVLATGFNGFIGVTLIGLSRDINRKDYWPVSVDLTLNLVYTLLFSFGFCKMYGFEKGLTLTVFLVISFSLCAGITKALES